MAADPGTGECDQPLRVKWRLVRQRALAPHPHPFISHPHTHPPTPYQPASRVLWLLGAAPLGKLCARPHSDLEVHHRHGGAVSVFVARVEGCVCVFAHVFCGVDFLCCLRSGAVRMAAALSLIAPGTGCVYSHVCLQLLVSQSAHPLRPSPSASIRRCCRP